MSPHRFICIHGHFYQPPRENPWLGRIETQKSAHPFHDWNERITAECYRPNAAPLILDREGRPVPAPNSYERISFNFGPTLLSWLEAKASDVYAAILEADRKSAERFSGHGSAIAQAYNHMILPLANQPDKITQVAWGIRDFVRRFGRAPEGMWLPETAVDLASLEALAEQGIAFTILAPHQAARVRRLGRSEWTEVGEREGTVDTRRPYRVPLPSGREIAVFFYEGAISRGVAFERLLESGEVLVDRLLASFDAGTVEDQLVHIASDGETYGHHHRFGDMALAYALAHLETGGRARLTNYGEYLAAHPPEHEAEVLEGTSWSCPHGLGRWMRDCGCRERSVTHQRWRGPLREALDGLRDAIAPAFELKVRELLTDPWAARDDFLDVVLDGSPEAVETFFSRHASRVLSAQERVDALQLLELQRHALLMYTSCGWFFDDIAGLEARQVLLYAGRSIELAERLLGGDFEEPFLTRLALAEGNDPDCGNGRRVYEDFVRTARAGPSRGADGVFGMVRNA